MIQKLQKIFYTDKWWGSLLLFASFYILYFMLGYWIWFLLPGMRCSDCKSYLMDLISPLYFFGILPILSFIFVYKIRNKFNFRIDKLILFIVNLIIVLINLFLFILSVVSSIKPEMFI